MIHYHMEKAWPMIKDRGKITEQQNLCSEIEKRTFFCNRGKSTSKFFQIPADLTNTDTEGTEEKPTEICDLMPTSTGEGRIRENLKCAEKQAASAREVPASNRFYSSLLQDQERRKKEIVEALPS